MDLKGYKILKTEFKEAHMDVVISPKPKKGEDVPFVTIDSDPASHTAADILNTLARTGFMNIENHTDLPPHLSLRFLGTTGINGVLLEDTAAESIDYDH